MRNLILLLISFVSFIKDFYSQKKYFKKIPVIQSFLEKNKLSLTKREIYRINDYSVRLYALIVKATSYLSNAKITDETRFYSTLISALTPEYDDFVDNCKINYNDFKQILKQPVDVIRSSMANASNLGILNLALNNIPKNKIKELIPIIAKVHFIQYQSKNQYSGSISKDYTEYLTCAKGGYSVLFSRYLINNNLDVDEYNILYQFGAMVQFVDDIFDIKSDLLNGIKTLPNSFLTLSQSQEKLTSYFNNLICLVKNSHFGTYPKLKLIFKAFMFYLNGMAILYQYINYREKYGSTFEFKNLTKDEIELKWYNIKIILYIFRLAFSYNININSH